MEMIPAEAVKKIDETHDAVIELRTLLKGHNGTPGLCSVVEGNSKRLRQLELILAFAAGGGGITGGIIGISRLLGG